MNVFALGQTVFFHHFDVHIFKTVEDRIVDFRDHRNVDALNIHFPFEQHLHTHGSRQCHGTCHGRVGGQCAEDEIFHSEIPSKGKTGDTPRPRQGDFPLRPFTPSAHPTSTRLPGVAEGTRTPPGLGW